MLINLFHYYFFEGAITIFNQNIIDRGFCHQQDVNIQLFINCSIPFSATITVAIVTSKYETNPNTLLTCRRSNDSTWYCPKFDIMTGKFYSSTSLLVINFKFNFTIHAGFYVRMTSSCDENQESKHIHLIPCCKFKKLFVACLLINYMIFNSITNHDWYFF